MIIKKVIYVLVIGIVLPSFFIIRDKKLNGLFSRVRGWSVKHTLRECGKNLRVGKNVKFFNPQKIQLGDNCDVADDVVFAPLGIPYFCIGNLIREKRYSEKWNKKVLQILIIAFAITTLAERFALVNAVVAAIYNYENHMTEFQMILDEKQRERAKGSKYMQSKPGDIYREAYRSLTRCFQ